MQKFWIWSVLLCAAGAAQSEDSILLSYYERAPYAVRQVDGAVTGLTADPAAAAFTKAGIPYQWQLVPARRQIANMESAITRECALGWYKTAERSQMGKFTDPIYRDKPTVAIARVAFQPGKPTLAALVADPSVRVLMKSGLTYGQDVPRIMATAKANVQVIVGEQTTLTRMVVANRADFMFSPYEEAQSLIASSQMGNPKEGQRLKMLTFDDVVQGPTRHIWCSKMVSDDTIARLNQAIAHHTNLGKQVPTKH